MMDGRFILPFISALLVIFLSCGKNLRAEDLPALSLYSSPEKIIATLNQSGKDPVANYILAGAYRDKKQYKKALCYYANSCFLNEFDFSLGLGPNKVYEFVRKKTSKSGYYNDSIYAIASIFFDYSKHEHVLKFIDLMKKDGSVLYRDAILIKSRSLVKLGRSGEAVSMLEKLSREYNDSISPSLILIRLCAIYEETGEYENAKNFYMGIVYTGYDLEQWLKTIAAKKLAWLREKKKVKLNDHELLIVAGALFDAGEVAGAGKYADILLSRGYSEDAAVIKLKVLTVTKYRESLKFMKKFEGRPGYEKILLVHSDLLYSSGHKSEALKNYIKLSASQDSSVIRHVLPRIISYYEERGKKDFIPYAEKFAGNFPGENLSAKFLWFCGRYWLKNNEKVKAALYMNEAVNKFPAAPYTAYCRYWLYKISGSTDDNERLQTIAGLCANNPDSQFTYMMLSDEAGRHDAKYFMKRYSDAEYSGDMNMMLLYHMLLFIKEGFTQAGLSRLKDFDDDFMDAYDAIRELVADPSYKSSFAEKIAGMEKYFAAGDVESITREMQCLPDKDPAVRRDIDLAFTLFALKYGFWSMGAYYAERLLDDFNLKENVALLPERLVKALYPAPFSDCVKEYSKKNKVEMPLIYSMMKSESNFNHRVKSSAGAIGLMQLMPSTAAGIAKKLRLKQYDLKDPCTSVMLGAYYIAGLSVRYKGQLEYVVAAYNAGAGNVNKWIKSGSFTDKDFFAEFVPFYETRHYIYRTKKFMIIYKSIYRW